MKPTQVGHAVVEASREPSAGRVSKSWHGVQAPRADKILAVGVEDPASLRDIHPVMIVAA